MRLLSFLKHPGYFLVFLATAFLVFDIQWYVMSALPGHRDEMCVVGGNFTAFNILFAVLMALLCGLLVLGFAALFRGRSQKSVPKEKKGRLLGAHSFMGGVGAAVGFLTVFCTVCTVSVISLFGFSIGIQAFAAWFVEYDLFMKIASLLLLAAACFMLNRQLEQRCLVCVRS